MRQKSKYFWPASALKEEHMAMLHHTREHSIPRIPISHLIAQAIEQAYGQKETPINNHHPRKEAA